MGFSIQLTVAASTKHTLHEYMHTCTVSNSDVQVHMELLEIVVFDEADRQKHCLGLTLELGFK